jgi:hypothetical protein
MGSDDKPQLINFIAVEPVTTGDGPRNTRMALSELEMSLIDKGEHGKRLGSPNPAGDLTTGTADDKLTVRIEVEPFTANQAHVYLLATVTARRPDELQLRVHHYDDSAPIEELTLTATMGNKERLRQLWLKNEIVDSRELYNGYAGNDFVEKSEYSLNQMLTRNGDAVAIATTNEADPSSVTVWEKPSWSYRSKKLTQYWRVPKADIQDNLRVRVNGRRVYWKSTTEVPGGIAFENFEVRQHYVPGQSFVFGLSSKEPKQLLELE